MQLYSLLVVLQFPVPRMAWNKYNRFICRRASRNILREVSEASLVQAWNLRIKPWEIYTGICRSRRYTQRSRFVAVSYLSAPRLCEYKSMVGAVVMLDTLRGTNVFVRGVGWNISSGHLVAGSRNVSCGNRSTF